MLHSVSKCFRVLQTIYTYLLAAVVAFLLIQKVGAVSYSTLELTPPGNGVVYSSTMQTHPKIISNSYDIRGTDARGRMTKHRAH